MKKQDLIRENHRLRRLLKLSVQEEKTSFVCAADIANKYMIKMGSMEVEHFYAVLLDNKHKEINTHLISKGTLNQSLVHPREVFHPAVLHRAAAVIILHNHPSGDPSPSKQDIEITNRLKEASDILGIKLLDHLIIGGNKFFSFVEEDLL